MPEAGWMRILRRLTVASIAGACAITIPVHRYTTDTPLVESAACDTGFSAAAAPAALTPSDEKDVTSDATRAVSDTWGAA